MTPLRICRKCGLEAISNDDLELFKKASINKYGRANYCKSCANEDRIISRLNNGSKRLNRRPDGFFINKRESKLFYRYGLRFRDYFKIFKKQLGVCAICGTEPSGKRNGGHKFLAVDHSHKSGNVRGLLCMKCNTDLSVLENNESILYNMQEYLSLHK